MHRFSDPLRARTITLVALGFGSAAMAGVILARRRNQDVQPITLRASITIRRQPEDVYRFWRDLANLPLFMRHVERVTESDGHLRWFARGPLNAWLEWEAEIVADRANERIAWRSLEGTAIANYGSVEFRHAPRGQGTEVHLQLGFQPPLAVGAKLARLFEQVPELALENDLRRLKQILEVGEVVHSDASIHRGFHPARPLESEELPLARESAFGGSVHA